MGAAGCHASIATERGRSGLGGVVALAFRRPRRDRPDTKGRRQVSQDDFERKIPVDAPETALARIKQLRAEWPSIHSKPPFLNPWDTIHTLWEEVGRIGEATL